jgi:hypothetical protein
VQLYDTPLDIKDDIDLGDNKTEADHQFHRYMEMFTDARRAGATHEIAEEVVVRADNRTGEVKKWTGTNQDKKKAAQTLWRKKRGEMIAKRRRRNMPSQKAAEKRKHEANKKAGVFRKVSLIRTGKAEKSLKEWGTLSANVQGFVHLVENGDWTGQTIVATNPQGDVTAVTLPTSKARNEGKILSLQYKTLKTDVKVLREAARGLAFNETFVKAVSHIKRLNNMAHAAELEESLGGLVSQFPGVLYLTQPELAKVIGQALEHAGQTNYDDQTCAFMAEGILRVAHDAFADRVGRITQLANTDVKVEGDAYEQFQAVAATLFKQLDEARVNEMQVFTDLYNALVDVRRLALESKNEAVRDEATAHLEGLRAVIEGHAAPELDLAATVAEWLQDLVESNVEGAKDSWDVSNNPYITDCGEHPQMAKNAKVPGHPGGSPDGYGDSAPVSDGKSYKGGEADIMRNKAWGNKGGKGVYPDLNNPYTPKPFGDYTMKGEPGTDKNSDGGLAQDQGSDTWPNLSNPYLPKGETPQSYKAKSDNLVVDK